MSAPEDTTLEVYDFRRPTTLVREHSRVLETGFETFARQWGTQLTAKVRVVSQVTLDQVAMQTYDAYVASLRPTTAMILCEVEGSESRAVVQFPTEAVLDWISHMLGGTGAVKVPERKFTPVEEALIRNLVTEAIGELRYSLGGVLPAAMEVVSIQHNSQFAQAAPTGELMLVATLTMRVGETSTKATIAVPAEAILPQLGESAAAKPTPEEVRRRLEHQLMDVPVEISVHYHPASVTGAQILGLQVGDVIALPHPEHLPLNVTVDGHTVAHAVRAEFGNRLVAKITNTEEHA